MTRISRTVAILLLFVANVAATRAPAAPPVELRVKASPNPPVSIEVLQVGADPGHDLEFFLRVQNVSSEPLAVLEVSLEQRDARGRARAFESYLARADLEPGEELYVGRKTTHFRLHGGDVVSLAVQPYGEPFPNQSAPETTPASGRTEVTAISSCISFAEQCTKNSVRLCGKAEASSFECECRDAVLRHQLECGG